MCTKRPDCSGQGIQWQRVDLNGTPFNAPAVAAAAYPSGYKAVFHHHTGRYLMDSIIAEGVEAMLGAAE
ncbi:MAG: hypothetical protein R6W95_01325 [Desulfosarcina sp.]